MPALLESQVVWAARAGCEPRMGALVMPLMVLIVPASAHHAFAAEYDAKKHVILKGTVTKMEWINPHAWIHIDVKKQAKIPPGGGWRMNPKGYIGRIRNGEGGRPRLGYAYVHSAVDAYSRLAYSEVHANELATTAIAFWRRAQAHRVATVGSPVGSRPALSAPVSLLPLRRASPPPLPGSARSC